MGTYVNKLLRKIMPMFYLIIKETYFLSASTMTKKARDIHARYGVVNHFVSLSILQECCFVSLS